jgi:hypothetical protein
VLRDCKHFATIKHPVMSTPAMIAGMSSGNAIASQIQTNQAVKKMENEYAEWLDKDTKRRQRKREQEIEAEFELAHLIQQLSMEDDDEDGDRTPVSSNVPLSNHSNLHANTTSVSTSTTTTSSLVQNSHQQHQYAVGIQLLPSEQTLMDQLYRSRLDSISSSPRSDSTSLFLTKDPTARSHFALEVAPEFNQVMTTVFKSIALDILRGEHPPINQQQPQPQYSGRFVSLTKALDGLRRTTEEFQIKCNQLIGLLQQHP